MGLLSFGFGACFGYYLRNTRFGTELGRKILIASKVLKSDLDVQYSLILVVRDDLNMGKGKMASQCSHASVMAYKNTLGSNPDLADSWDAFGQGKIVLKVSGESKLIELSNEAKKLGLFTNIVHDAGKTQISPGTKTVLAIGPGPKNVIDKVTAHLKLL